MVCSLYLIINVINLYVIGRHVEVISKHIVSIGVMQLLARMYGK